MSQLESEKFKIKKLHFHLLDTITAIQVKGVIETSIHTNQNARWNAAEGLHGEVLRQRKNKNE